MSQAHVVPRSTSSQKGTAIYSTSPTVESSAVPAVLPSILLVDDEVAILDGLRRQLRRRFTVHTATSGAEGLVVLENEPVTVVVSDMRMSEMDGATFLSHVRTRHPDIVRILLTGQADTQAAIAAVNHGNIYRFLTKPCPSEVFIEELAGAVELHRLRTAEKHLLATTLRRTVEALIATLSLAQPSAFARAQRIADTTKEIAQQLDLDDAWEVEITAQLSFLGAVALPPALLAKIDAGLPLNDDEEAMVARVPALSRDLVAAIPRLESVAEAIGLQTARFDGASSRIGVPRGQDLPIAARVLKVAIDFEQCVTRQRSAERALVTLRANEGAHDPAVLDALTRCYDFSAAVPVPREVGINELTTRMVIFDDILTDDGLLLVGRGTTVTPALVERLENFADRGRIGVRLVVTEGPG